MLASWKCEHCELYNNPRKKQCQACFNITKQLTHLDEIAYKQTLIFNGFIKTEIYQFHSFIPKDIINLCKKFYEIDMKLSYENDHETRELIRFYEECETNKEYFIAYKLAHLLLALHPEEVVFHTYLGAVLADWNLHPEAEEEYRIAVELSPDDDGLRDCYGAILASHGKYQLALTEWLKAIELNPGKFPKKYVDIRPFKLYLFFTV